jgi:hypothetical protein
MDSSYLIFLYIFNKNHKNVQMTDSFARFSI